MDTDDDIDEKEARRTPLHKVLEPTQWEYQMKVQEVPYWWDLVQSVKEDELESFSSIF